MCTLHLVSEPKRLFKLHMLGKKMKTGVESAGQSVATRNDLTIRMAYAFSFHDRQDQRIRKSRFW